jgi:hypothetical protein
MGAFGPFYGFWLTSLRSDSLLSESERAEYRCLVVWTFKAHVREIDIWLFEQDKSHEIKISKNYYYNFYFYFARIKF